MALDLITLRRMLQARPDLAEVLGQGTAAPTQATAPTAGGFMPTPTAAPPSDILSGQGGQSAQTGLSGFMPESLTRPSEPADEGLFGSAGDDRLGGGLWDRVKGFFDPDEDDTAGSYDQDVNAAAWAGASQAAAQAASNPQLSPIQVLTQALAGYSGAKARAKGELRGQEQKDRILALQERGLEAEAAKLQVEADQRARIQEAIKGIEDPVQRRAAELNYEAYGEQLAKQAFPDPQNLIEVEGGGIFDPNTRQFIVQPTVKPTTPFGSDAVGYFQVQPDGSVVQKVAGLGREGREAPETFRDLTQDELIKRGYPTGTTGQISSRGKVFADRPAVGSLPQVAQLQAIRDGLASDDPRRAEVQRVIDKLGASGAESEPVEAVVTPEGIRLVPRSQAVGMQPAPRETGGTGDERLDAEILGMKQEVIDARGFQNFTLPRLALYRRKYNRLAQTRTDAAGNEITPLITDLPKPPPITAAELGISQGPGGPPPTDVPVIDPNAPPGSSLLPPSPGVTPLMPQPLSAPGAPPAPTVGAPPVAVPAPPPSAIPPGITYPDPNQPNIRQVTNTAAAREKIAKVGAARGALDAAINDYRDLVRKGGWKIPGSPAVAALEASRTRVKLRAKDVYELGALTGPDDTLMNDLVPSATGLSQFGNDIGRVEAGLGQLTNDLDAQLAATQQAYGPPGSTGANFSGMSAAAADKAFDQLPVGATFTDTDGKTKRKEAR